MNEAGLACLICQVVFDHGTDQYCCPQCGRNYASTLGIPSLCGSDIEPGPIERELIERQMAMYDTASIEELARARLATAATNEERRQIHANYRRGLRERGPAFHRMFQQRLQQQGGSDYGRRLALDIGCGSGSGLLALAREFDHVVGLDISLSSLIIARKVLTKEGVRNVTLVHAFASHDKARRVFQPERPAPADGGLAAYGALGTAAGTDAALVAQGLTPCRWF